MGHDTPVGTRLVIGEGLAEMHNVVEAGQQHLAQRDPTYRAMPGDSIALLHHVAPDREQHLHLLGEEMHGMRGLAASAVEGVEQMRRQTGVQRAAAGWIDVHAIALQAIGEGTVALVDGDAHAGLLEALGETEAPDAAADDDDMERRDAGVERVAAIGRGHRTIPA